VVLTVRMEDPAPPATNTEAGLNEQPGAATEAGEPFRVMLLQASFTVSVKPLNPVTVTNVKTDFPGETGPGGSPAEVTVKFWRFKETVLVCLSEPDVPVTATA
jgi:hypothetical protein